MRNFRSCLKLVFPVFSLFMLLNLISCSAKPSKEQYIENFTAFIDEVTKDAKDYTDEDWQKADKTFRKLVEQNSPEYDDLLTAKERRLIGKLEGRYLILRAKSGFKKMKKELDELKDQGEGFFEAIKESLKDSGIDVESMTE